VSERVGPVASTGPTVETGVTIPAAVPELRASRRWLVLAGLAGVGVLAFLITRADLQRLVDTARGISPARLLLPVLATLGSYLTMARSYQGIAAAAGWNFPFGDMCRITLVANTANYLLSTAGLSGFALRMYLFRRRGTPTSIAVIISLVQTLLTNLVLLVFVIAGFVLLLFSHNLMGRELLVATTLLLGFSALVLVTSIVVLHRNWRRGILFRCTHLLDRALARLTPQRRPQRLTLMRFQRTLHVGLDFLLERPHEMLVPTLYIFLDWIFTLLVLYTSFVAIGYPIAMTHVIAGFAIGMFCSLVSLVPGGLGVLEGSMAAVFASLNVPLEHAVVAVLIFRAAYYGLPVLASLPLMHRTVRA